MWSRSDTSPSRHGLITGVVCLALAAVVAAMASLNVALPDIARDTRASQTDLVWVIDAYSLAFAALLLPAGAIGIGAALVMPATLSTITSTFPDSKRTRAVSIWAAVAGGAAVLGLLASGALLTSFSWRSIFALKVVLAALALAGTLRFVPESADPDSPRLDLGVP